MQFLKYSSITSILLLLAAAAATTAFPQGRCYVPECQASVYDVKWLQQTTNGTMCFVINTKACEDDSKYNCCNLLRDNLNKIVIKSRPECDRTVKKVRVDGVPKAGGLYFEKSVTWAEMRITSLRMNESTAGGRVVCMDIAPPCDTIATFCPEPCKYSIFDPVYHLCCPTCDLTIPIASTQSPPLVSEPPVPKPSSSPPPPPPPVPKPSSSPPPPPPPPVPKLSPKPSPPPPPSPPVPKLSPKPSPSPSSPSSSPTLSFVLVPPPPTPQQKCSPVCEQYCCKCCE